MAPTARFIWPSPITIIWAMATMPVTDRIRSITNRFVRVRKAGAINDRMIIDKTVIPRIGNHSAFVNRLE